MATDNTAKNKRNQMIGAAVVLALFVLTVYLFLAPEGKTSRAKAEQSKVSLVQKRDIRPEQEWTNRGEKRLETIEKQMGDILKTRETGPSAELRRLEQRIAELDQKLKSNEADGKKVIDAYSDEVKRLANENETLKRTASADKLASASTDVTAQGDFINRGQPGPRKAGATVPSASEARATPKGIETINVALKQPLRGRTTGKNIEKYVPVNSYVKAKVLSGADASAGVVSQAEPRPVLFRIQGDAIAALHNGEEQRIDLDGCSIGGSAYGDLSSERVYVRTQNMTCARDPKTVIERNVKAYIAGSAKAGVRGEVVSREGDFITTALLAGVVSGFGRGLSQSSSGSLGGITIQQGTQERSTGDVFQQGLGEGLSTSSDRISNYLIRRAEQYQPVIMLQAGRDDVEIVFLEGVDLSDNYKASAKAEEAKPASNSMPNARNPNL